MSNEQVVERIRADRFRGSDRSGLNVVVWTPGWRLIDGLQPVDAQSRVDRRDQIIDDGLALILPAGVRARARDLVGRSHDVAAFNASADPCRGEDLIVMIASRRVV